MNHKRVRITVEGSMASGKSAIIGMITTLLQTFGIEAEVEQNEDGPAAYDDWAKKLSGLKEQGLEVSVCEKRVMCLYFDGPLVTPPPEEDPPWIEWNGGECPVDSKTKVEVGLRVGQVFECWPEQAEWLHHSDPADIVKYRVAQPAQPHQLDQTSCRAGDPRDT